MKNNSDKKLDKAIDLLKKTDAGTALLEFARENNIPIYARNRSIFNTIAASYSPKRKTIVVDAGLFISTRQLARTIAHELLHAWQDHQGLLSLIPNSYASYTIYERFVEATAHAIEKVVDHEIMMKTTYDWKSSDKDFVARHFNQSVSEGFASYLYRFTVMWQYGRESDRRFRRYIRKANPDYTSSDRDFEMSAQTIQNLSDLYGCLPNGRNFIHEAGGLSDIHVESLLKPRKFKL